MSDPGNMTAQQAFWLVWNENGRVPMYRHDTLESAQTEAERLARANPGETFYVLEAVGLRVVDNMKRIDFGSPAMDGTCFACGEKHGGLACPRTAPFA